MSTARKDHQQLLQEALKPTPAPEIKAEPVSAWQKTLKLFPRSQRLRTQNGLPVFYRALAAMFSSGIKLARGLEILAKQNDEPVLEEVLPQVVKLLWEGSPMSKALKPFPLIFAPLHVKLIEVGEATGKLSKVLIQIAEYEERRAQVTMKIKSAMTYPIFLFSMSMLLVVLGPPYMFGGLLKFIQQSNGQIPTVTKMLLAFSAFVTSPWFFLFLALVLWCGYRFMLHLQTSEIARRDLVITLMRVPVLGKTIRTVAVCRFARSLATTLEAGIGILQGIAMAAESSDNPVLVEKLVQGVEDLRDGNMLNEVLAKTEFFPRAFIMIVKVGEETGEVAELIKRIAEMYEMEMEEALNQLLAMMEPIWMLVMGIMIGFLAVATLMPIMSLLNTL